MYVLFSVPLVHGITLLHFSILVQLANIGQYIGNDSLLKKPWISMWNCTLV